MSQAKCNAKNTSKQETTTTGNKRTMFQVPSASPKVPWSKFSALGDVARQGSALKWLAFYLVFFVCSLWLYIMCKSECCSCGVHEEAMRRPYSRPPPSRTIPPPPPQWMYRRPPPARTIPTLPPQQPTPPLIPSSLFWMTHLWMSLFCV